MKIIPILENDNLEEKIPNETCYILAKDGFYIKKEMLTLQSITKIPEISLFGNISEFVKIKTPKFPILLLSETLLFFREVYNLYKSEAILLILYNSSKRDFKLSCPIQKTSSAFLKYKHTDTFKGYHLFGSIHSHGNASAFHSGIDVKDEFDFDGLHITLGNVNDEKISISCCFVINGKRFEQNISNIIDISESNNINNKKYFIDTSSISINDKWINKVNNEGLEELEDVKQIKLFNDILAKEWTYDSSRYTKYLDSFNSRSFCSFNEKEDIKEEDDDKDESFTEFIGDLTYDICDDLLENGLMKDEDWVEVNLLLKHYLENITELYQDYLETTTDQNYTLSDIPKNIFSNLDPTNFIGELNETIKESKHD